MPRHSINPNVKTIISVSRYINSLKYSTSESSAKNDLLENPFEQLIKEKKELIAKQNPVLQERNEVNYEYLSNKVESLSNQVKVLQKKFHSLFIENRNPGYKYPNSHLHHIKGANDKNSNNFSKKDNPISIDTLYFEENAKALQKYWSEEIKKRGQPHLVYLKKRILELRVAKIIDENITYCYSTIGKLSLILNDITGYAIINTLKEKITDLESKISNVTKSYKSTKNDYTNLIDERNSNSKRINELLIRKNNWSNEDLQRFTDLYTNEHKLDQKVVQLTNTVKQLEDDLENLQDLLIKEISKKNNEEYLWNIKMRILSSWVTVGLMILNILILIFTHWILEPLKIKRTLNEFDNQFEFDEKLKQLEYQIQNLNQNKKQIDFNNSGIYSEATLVANEDNENNVQEKQDDNSASREAPLQLQEEISATTKNPMIWQLYNDPKNWKLYLSSIFEKSYKIIIETYRNPKNTYAYLKGSFTKWLNSEYYISNLDMMILIGSVYTVVKFAI